MYGVAFRIGTGEAMLASAEIIALIPAVLLKAPWWVYVMITGAVVLAFIGGRIDKNAELRDPKNFRNGSAGYPFWTRYRK